MSIEDVKSCIEDKIDSLSQEYGINDRGHAFAIWIIHYLKDISIDDAIDYCDTIHHGDAGLDAYYYDEIENIFFLYQIKYKSKSSRRRFGTPIIKEILTALTIISDKELVLEKKNKKLIEISRLFNDAKKNGAKIRLGIIVFGEFIESAKKEFVLRCEKHPLRPSCEVWDIKEIHNNWLNSDIIDLKGKEIKLHINENELFEVKPPKEGAIKNSLVTNLNTLTFIESIRNYIPYIYSSNLRFKLDNANKVNLDLEKTINEDPFHFWHYNNGITIIVDHYEYSDSELKLWNPQIVNGAQTTSILSRKIDSIKNECQLLARIIKVDTENGENEINNITKYTNSQSPVRSFDFKANDEVQKHIQLKFKSLNPSWFYERKRGEWNLVKQQKSQKRKFDNRKIKMIDLGQIFYSFIGNPAEAINKKELIFTSDSLYQSIFKDEISIECYLLSYQLYLIFNGQIHSKKIDEINAIINTPLITEPLMKKFLSAKKLVVAHSIAMSKLLLEKRYGELTQTVLKEINKLLYSNEITKNVLLKLVFMTMKTSFEDEKINIKNELRKDDTFNRLWGKCEEYLALINLDNDLPDIIKE